MSFTDVSRMASLLAHLDGPQKSFPLDEWSPKDCGPLPIRIDQDGQWWSTDGPQPTPFLRTNLVRLLSQLLWCEPADYRPGQPHPQYSLRTPTESVTITVVDTPFVIVDFTWTTNKENGEPVLICQTHTGESVEVIAKDQLTLGPPPHLPYVRIRRNLWARFNRNSYYRLIDHALEINNTHTSLIISSHGIQFNLAGEFMDEA